MPISFACGQCGKDYMVSDGLAGKRATCKACNNRMVIPGEAPSGPPPAPSAPRPSARPASAQTALRPTAAPATARPAAAPAARPIPRRPEPEPVADDIYGLDEAPAPLPPMMPRSFGTSEAMTVEKPVKTKKKKGFFSSSVKKSPTKSFAFSGIGLGGGFWVVGIVIGLIAAVIGGFGLSSKSNLEGVIQQLIVQANQTASTLETIRDLPTASASRAKVKAEFEAIFHTLELNKNKKGRKNDIDDINRRYVPQVEASFRRLGEAAARVNQIPAAGVALQIEPMIAKMMGLLEEVSRNG